MVAENVYFHIFNYPCGMKNRLYTLYDKNKKFVARASESAIIKIGGIDGEILKLSFKLEDIALILFRLRSEVI